MTTLALGDCALTWEAASPAETERAGEILGGCLGPGDVVALSGELGSGKTVLVRGLARGLGCSETDVHSPSFTLVNEYAIRRGRALLAAAGCRCLAHVDLYRIRSEAELPGIGWDEYLRSCYILAVEWAERAGGQLPRDHLQVWLDVREAERRGFRAQAMGPRAARILRDWASALGADVRLA
jgi:tRNA threonylcarbamoyladenosine biosynthesis protein TsaE